MDTAIHTAKASASANTWVDSLRRRLHSSGYGVLRQISCQQHDGAIVLRGCVPSFYLKQMAQAVLMADPRVVRVVNLIEVASDADSCDDPSATALAPVSKTLLS